MFYFGWLILFVSVVNGLYPFDTISREVRDLSGLWWFKSETSNSIGYGFSEKWFLKDISAMKGAIKMPVPSSFNDVTQDPALKLHVGWVWYERVFFVPKSWQDQRIVLRFDSIHYFATVWLNGEHVMNHTGGKLPFENVVNQFCDLNSVNKLTVAVNNTLSHMTIPPAEFVYKTDKTWYPEGYFDMTLDFDFFNFAGIERPVRIYTTPRTHITEIVFSTISVDPDSLRATVSVDVSTSPGPDSANLQVQVLLDGLVYSQRFSETWEIRGVKLWWPRNTADHQEPYLYNLTVVLAADNQTVDVYSLPVGVREVSIGNRSILINKRPVYLKGFGMHEDYEVRGRGFDYTMMVKDLNLLQWTAANSFRTSHYPYSEERMFEADRLGFLVLDELPAVGVRYFTQSNLQLHKSFLRELISRDRNHPSVIAWSLANEPHTDLPQSRTYFQEIIKLSHQLDPSRPVTIVYNAPFDKEQTADLVDFICLNRYYGWYIDRGRVDLIDKKLSFDLNSWHLRFKKAMVLTEYGAEAIAGLNTDPPEPFSDSYQVNLLRETQKVLDKFRPEFLAGEMIWNFADFMTNPAKDRAVGNRKGIFYRNRQPKMAAYFVKERYEKLEREREM